MGRMMDAIEAFFREEDCTTKPLEDLDGYQAGFMGDHGPLMVFAQARDEYDQIIVYSTLPDDVPEDRRAAVGELLHRLNYGLVIGNFEIDYDDGEVRYKSAADFEGADASLLALRNLVYPNVLTFDRCVPAIQAVMRGELSPTEAQASIADG